MSKFKIETQEERERYLSFAYSNHVIRPSLHAISKATGTLFFIMLATTTGYLNWLLDSYPRFGYFVVVFISYLLANYLEDKVSRAINNFSFAVVRWKKSLENKALTIAALVVLLPILAISAVTSFSGIQGNIDTGDLGFNKAKEELKAIDAEKEQSAKSEINQLNTYKKDRAEDRKKLLENQKQEVDSAIELCKELNSGWQARKDCSDPKVAEIKAIYAKKIAEFDEATTKAVNEKQSVIDQMKRSTMSDKDNLISRLNQELDTKNKQVKWVAGFVGWGAMFFEALALIAALLVNFILHITDSTEKEMVKVGSQSEVQMGLFKSVWLTLSGFFLGSRQKK